MSTFDERKKSFEKKFAHDEELQFKVSAKRNKYIGQWVSQILGYNSDQEKEYIQTVIKADFAEAGDQDVVLVGVNGIEQVMQGMGSSKPIAGLQHKDPVATAALDRLVEGVIDPLV